MAACTLYLTRELRQQSTSNKWQVCFNLSVAQAEKNGYNSKRKQRTKWSCSDDYVDASRENDDEEGDGLSASISNCLKGLT
jgi:hypothetical protein